ncbi:MAG: glycosyltransferase [Anaerolineae bacterium]|nr:glycosyltransferase [Anaerolineae bacterium]
MVENMRVLVVTNIYPTEREPGTNPCVKDQVLALRELGVEIDLLYINRWNKLNYFKAALQVFLTSFGRKRYDLIHAHYGHCGWVARVQLRAPLVVTFHGSDLLSRKDGAIGKVAARWADGVIVMTDEMKRASKRADASVIPFGVDTALFHPRPVEEARHELGLPLDAGLVLFPWDPKRPVKRFDIVEASMQLVQQTHPNARLEVVYNQSREIIARYMNACDAMVLTSDHEGSPMAVREALACLLPVVSVDVGDVRQLIGDIDGCHLCAQEPRDVADKLGQALARRRRLDPAQAQRRVDAASAARQVLEVYERVLKRKS